MRDPTHGFIKFSHLEKKIIDSRPFQRLRSIHQLALTYQVYPGATHRRFEHCLGVMEVATRIFDTLFQGRLCDGVHDALNEHLGDEKQQDYWRKVVRIAALLHDLGHLPFSHAAEAELLPTGWDHERLTAEIIRHSEIAEILRSERPPIDPEDVIDIAYSPKDRAKTEPEKTLSPWKALLNEIITGNTFGADRIDYLLRDSYHAGVIYGKFDHDRLIQGLRLFPSATGDIVIGLDIGSIHAAESLLLARYFMYTQVYFHDVRRAYDQHLQDFLKHWLPGGRFSDNWLDMLQITDNEVLTALMKAIESHDSPELKELAERVVMRKHFRTVYTLSGLDKKKRPDIFNELMAYANDEFGPENIRCSTYLPKSEPNNFSVINDNGEEESSLSASGVIATLPGIELGLIFANENIGSRARIAIRNKRKELLEGGNDGH